MNCAKCKRLASSFELHRGLCTTCLVDEFEELRTRAEKAERACAEMRNTIEIIGLENHNLEIPQWCKVCSAVDKALATDAGKDYVPRAELETIKALLLNLLARIHRDGGHYTDLHGMATSVKSADEIVVGWQVRGMGAGRDGLGAANEDEIKCKACPECGCELFNHENSVGKGYKVCAKCGQEWWINIDYPDNPSTTPANSE